MARNFKTPSQMNLKELYKRKADNLSAILEALNQNKRIKELIKRKENPTPKEKKN